MAIKLNYQKEPAPGKNLGKVELYAIAVGTVVGAGVITLIVPAIKMTGYSAWLAYLGAIIMGFFMISPYVFAASTVRVSGGIYSLLNGLSGPKIGGIFALVSLIQPFVIALFGTSTAAYLCDTIPALNTTFWKIAIGVGVLFLFYYINMMGISIMAKAQKLMVWLLIASLIMFTIFGIAHLKLPIFNTSDPSWLINGWGIKFTSGKISGGFMGAVMLFIFSCNGYYATIGYGRDAKNAKHDIPKIILLVVPTLIVLYVGVAIAATGSMSLEEYGTSTTLVFAANKIMPAPLFYLFIIGGPIMALLSTLNTSFAANALNVIQSCADGWLPEWFGRKNKHGMPTVALTYFFILSSIPIVFQLSITTLTNMVQLIVAFFNILLFFGFIRMPKMYPNAWKKAEYHIPDALYYVLCVISLLICCLTIWKTILSIPTGLAIGSVVGIAVLTAIALYRSKHGDIHIETSIWSGDEVEDKHAIEMNAGK